LRALEPSELRCALWPDPPVVLRGILNDVYVSCEIWIRFPANVMRVIYLSATHKNGFLFAREKGLPTTSLKNKYCSSLLLSKTLSWEFLYTPVGYRLAL
jgi:hypothetical protein